MFWYAHDCKDKTDCPPYAKVEYSLFYDDGDEIMRKHEEENHIHAFPLPKNNDKKPTTQLPKTEKPGIPIPNHPVTITNASTSAPFTEKELKFWKKIDQSYTKEERDRIKRIGYDLRGLRCEIENEEIVCFLPHPLGRDRCPDYVTPKFLALADKQYSCQELDPDHYCVVVCQEGTSKVFWSAFGYEWCAQNPDNCAPVPEVIPYDQFAIKAWTEAPKPPKLCDSLPLSKFRKMTPISIVVLARGTETETLELSLSSWEEHGFIQSSAEFLFFINERTPESDKLLLPYTEPPFNAKMIGSPNNEGLFNGLKWLIGNATYEHVLFLEKDFRLTESITCTFEQLQAGLHLIEDGEADVVKYRSRYNGGKPNYAHILYAGKEETVFERQPNLLCNFYHWIEHPDRVWPNQFKVCNKDPLYYCVDSEYCNWTNNPFLIKKSWWFENYMEKFVEMVDPPEGFDLETFMNWHEGAWNDRGWTIAQGDGMFTHADTNKFGV